MVLNKSILTCSWSWTWFWSGRSFAGGSCISFIYQPFCAWSCSMFCVKTYFTCWPESFHWFPCSWLLVTWVAVSFGTCSSSGCCFRTANGPNSHKKIPSCFRVSLAIGPSSFPLSDPAPWSSSSHHSWYSSACVPHWQFIFQLCDFRRVSFYVDNLWFVFVLRLTLDEW